MQRLGYPNLVMQQTEATLYAPGFQDASASIAMVSLILFWWFFSHCSAALFFWFFSVPKMPHRPLTTGTAH